MHLGEDVCICGLVCREDATSKFINLCIFLYFCICQLNPSQVKVCISEKMCVFAAWMVEKMPQANWCFPRTYPQRPSLLLSNAQAQITLPKIQPHGKSFLTAAIILRLLTLWVPRHEATLLGTKYCWKRNFVPLVFCLFQMLNIKLVMKTWKVLPWDKSIEGQVML